MLSQSETSYSTLPELITESVPKKKPRFDKEAFEKKFIATLNDTSKSLLQQEKDEDYNVYVYHENIDKLTYEYCEKCSNKTRETSTFVNLNNQRKTF